MNLLPVSSLILASTLSAAPVTNLVLNDDFAVELPVGLHRVTTVSFPHPIEAIEGADITVDGHPQAAFQLAVHPTNSFFSLRALRPGAIANLNVRLAHRTFVLLLKESDNPVLAANFKEPEQTSAAIPSAPRLSPSQLVGLISKAKNFDDLRKHHPDAVADVTVVRPGSLTDYPSFTIKLEEVFRFDESDALVFRLTMTSKTEKPVQYRAGSFAVRIGDHVFPQAVADASGTIPAQRDVTAYFVIQGSPDGQRNDLSPRNNFIILLNPL